MDGSVSSLGRSVKRWNAKKRCISIRRKRRLQMKMYVNVGKMEDW